MITFFREAGARPAARMRTESGPRRQRKALVRKAKGNMRGGYVHSGWHLRASPLTGQTLSVSASGQWTSLPGCTRPVLHSGQGPTCSHQFAGTSPPKLKKNVETARNWCPYSFRDADVSYIVSPNERHLPVGGGLGDFLSYACGIGYVRAEVSHAMQVDD